MYNICFYSLYLSLLQYLCLVSWPVRVPLGLSSTYLNLQALIGVLVSCFDTTDLVSSIYIYVKDEESTRALDVLGVDGHNHLFSMTNTPTNYYVYI